MNSRLYRGTVFHERFGKITNRFRYPVYFVKVDLDELAALDDELHSFGHNRRAKLSVWDEDHGPRDGSPLLPWIRGVASGVGVDLEGGRVELLCFPRAWGFKFFPVSFWYCYTADGELRAILAEVQNTYRDRHNYLIHSHGEPLDLTRQFDHDKVFFVSPFIPIEDVRYAFRFSAPGDRLTASIFDRLGGEHLLTAGIDVTAEPLTDETALSALRQIGPMSFRAQALIFWQAFRLLLKGAKFYDHPAPPKEETTL